MKITKSDAVDSTQENIKSFNNDIRYVSIVQDSRLKNLFGFIPVHPADYIVDRKAYIKAMIKVQQEFQLEEGDPRLVLFVLEQLSRSPKITDSSDSLRKSKNKTKR